MVIDTYTAGRIYSLRQTIKPDEKIIVRYGSIIEIVKKSRRELVTERILNALRKVR